jgi:hypothetical protein
LVSGMASRRLRARLPKTEFWMRDLGNGLFFLGIRQEVVAKG